MKKLVEDLHQLFEDFKIDAASQVEKANKAAGVRARKASLAIEKAMRDFRKKSLETSKEAPKKASK